MKIKEGKKNAYNAFVEKCKQEKGTTFGLKFTEQWIAAMEMEVEQGKKLESVAKKALHSTMNSYPGFGCDLAIFSELLIEIWEYGNEFKKWLETNGLKEKLKQTEITVDMVVSHHASKRMHERCGLSKKAGKRMAMKAYVDGYSIEKTKGVLRSYFAKIITNTEDSGRVLAKGYGDHIFVFKHEPGYDVLVTVMKIPKQYLLNRKRECLT